MAAAGWLLKRTAASLSETLTLLRTQNQVFRRLLYPSFPSDTISPPPAPLPSPSSAFRSLRTLHCLTPPQFQPSDHKSTAASPDLASPASPQFHGFRAAPKISSYNHLIPFYPCKYLTASMASLPRWFSGKSKGRTSVQQGQRANHKDFIKKGNVKSSVSPLEASYSRERISGLESKSLKMTKFELSQKLTYALIPLLLLVSKSKVTTSVLLLSVFWQIYCFNKEIILDYVHHEVTRKWVLIYFQLLLIILVKDLILAFDL